MCVSMCVCVFPKEFFSTKKDEIMPFTRKCMGLKILILSRISETQKAENWRLCLSMEARWCVRAGRQMGTWGQGVQRMVANMSAVPEAESTTKSIVL